MKGTPNTYSAVELAWIEAHRHEPRPVAHAAFVAKFDRPDVTLGAYAGLCKRKGWATGRTGRFVAGQKSWNAGKSYPPHPNSAATQFKSGTVPPNRKPMGSERIAKDGYIEMKVPERDPHTGHATRYMHKHRWLWEQANGPVPKGAVLKCLDGDKTNTDPSNWVAIPRALLPRLAGGRWKRVPYDTAPDELKPTLLAIARLAHKVKERRSP